ncbi:MAG: iron-containing alcohol dehydrogenase [Christensenellales bacterium]|jgi:glycerol-1-phosphate dehydrogenase [NAD(P)+]
MNVDIVKKDGKLTLENLSCDCAFDHAMPDMDIYIRTGLIDGCAGCIAQSRLGKNVLIVADNNTYEAAAKKIENQLKSAGFVCRLCLLPGKKVEPTPQMASHILTFIDSSTEFLLSVGSGVITDLTRRSAFLAGLPFAVFGTAASMDGYTSITSAMIIDGMKLSEYGNSARLLMFDPAILASAPLLMQTSGVGDVLAKYNALVDWKLGHAVVSEVFCPLCEKLLAAALNQCTSHIEEIAKCTEKGMEALIGSLVLAGLTVLIVGSTRPVASVEHNITHYWEMRKIAFGENAPSHGIGAGIGLIYALMMHDRLRHADLSAVDVQKIKHSRMTKAQKESFIMNCYPPRVGKGVIHTNEEWYLEWPEQQRRIGALATYHVQYKKDCAILPDYRDIIRFFKLFGTPASAAKFGIDKNSLEKTLLCTKDYRARYSVASALSELGMLEECVADILAVENSQ